jgi:hypothetical protein
MAIVHILVVLAVKHLLGVTNSCLEFKPSFGMSNIMDVGS